MLNRSSFRALGIILLILGAALVGFSVLFVLKVEKDAYFEGECILTSAIVALSMDTETPSSNSYFGFTPKSILFTKPLPDATETGHKNNMSSSSIPAPQEGSLWSRLKDLWNNATTYALDSLQGKSATPMQERIDIQRYFVSPQTGKPVLFGPSDSISRVVQLDRLAFFYFVTIGMCYPFFRIVASVFDLERDSKTLFRHVQDVFIMLVMGFVLYILCDYQAFFDSFAAYVILASLAMYGFVSTKVKCLQVSLDNVMQWKSATWAIVGPLLTCVLLAAFYIVREGCLNSINTLFFIKAGTVASYFSCMAFTWWIQKPRPSLPRHHQLVFHLHHWQIFYALAFLSNMSDPICRVISSISIGIYMHGVIAYGYHEILLPS